MAACSAQPSPSKAKGLTPRRAAQLSGGLEVSGRKAVEDQLLEDITAALKEDVDLRWSVKALIDGKRTRKKDASRSLNRSVRYIVGSNQANGLPDWLLQECLSSMAQVDLSDLKRMCDRVLNCGRIVLWAVGGVDRLQLPATQMPAAGVVEWLCERHLAYGGALRGKRLMDPDGKVNWQTNLGFFSFIVEGEGQPIKSIRHNRSGATRVLPVEYRIQSSALGEGVHIVNNHIELQAEVVNNHTGQSLKLATAFFKAEVESAFTPWAQPAVVATPAVEVGVLMDQGAPNRAGGGFALRFFAGMRKKRLGEQAVAERRGKRRRGRGRASSAEAQGAAPAGEGAPSVDLAALGLA